MKLNNWVEDQPWRSLGFIEKVPGNLLCNDYPLEIDLSECPCGNVARCEGPIIFGSM